jgi:hypothetical protein
MLHEDKIAREYLRVNGRNLEMDFEVPKNFERENTGPTLGSIRVNSV